MLYLTLPSLTPTINKHINQSNKTNMDEAIKQISERLKGLRDVLDITVEEMANTCGITTDEYLAMENAESELHVSNLQKIALKYDIPLDVLMFGEEPHMSAYFLTRKGKGLSGETQSLPVRVIGKWVQRQKGRPIHRHRGAKARRHAHRDQHPRRAGV